jgi:hypothetical protein
MSSTLGFISGRGPWYAPSALKPTFLRGGGIMQPRCDSIEIQRDCKQGPAMPMSRFGDIVPWFDMPLIGIRRDLVSGHRKPRCAPPGIPLHLFQSNQGLAGGIMYCASTMGQLYGIVCFWVGHYLGKAILEPWAATGRVVPARRGAVPPCSDPARDAPG